MTTRRAGIGWNNNPVPQRGPTHIPVNRWPSAGLVSLRRRTSDNRPYLVLRVIGAGTLYCFDLAALKTGREVALVTPPSSVHGQGKHDRPSRQDPAHQAGVRNAAPTAPAQGPPRPPSGGPRVHEMRPDRVPATRDDDRAGNDASASVTPPRR